MTERTKVFTADIAERVVRVTWPDNDRGGATPPPDGWQDRAWAQEPTLHEIDQGSMSGCSILRWREDPRPDPELIGASLALVTGRPQAAPLAAAPPAERPLPPLLIGAQVEAYALVVRRQTCDDLAGKLRNDGQVLAANLVDENRDFTEMSRSLAAIPTAPKTEHGAYCRPFDCRCGCDRAQNCLDCHRCVCWRARCCAQVATDYTRARARKTALRALLDAVGPVMLTELRETVAEAEEAALRDTIARRVRLLTPADGPRYTHAVFAAYDSKLGMGHADYRLHGVQLHEDEDKHEDEGEGEVEPVTVDLDDNVLSAALGTLAGLLRPDQGEDLTVDLTIEDHAGHQHPPHARSTPMTERTKGFAADIVERAVRITWPDNDRGGATPPPDGWQDRAWAREPTLHDIDEGSVSGCSILRWREDPRSDAELIGASLALVTGEPHASLPAVSVSSGEEAETHSVE